MKRWGRLSPSAQDLLQIDVVIVVPGKVVAVVNGGGIYTSQSTPAPLLSITSSSGEAIISWTIPSTSFVLQQNSDLTSTNWTNVPAIPTLTNLRYQVTLSSPNGHDFYRLMQR